MLTAKVKRRILIAFVLAVIGAIAAGFWGSVLPFRNLISVCPANASVCGIDQGEKSYRFFQTDSTGILMGELRRDIQSEGCYRSYDDIVRDGDDFYVLERTAEIVSDRVVSETVLLCDFENSELVPMWELPVEDPSQDNNFQIQVRNGVLTFFQTDYQGKEAKAQLYSAEQEGAVRKILEFGFDIGVGFTEFYSAECGTAAFTTPAGEVYAVKPGLNPEEILLPMGAGPLVMTSNDGGNLLYLIDIHQNIYCADLSKAGYADRVTGLKSENVKSIAFDKGGKQYAAILSEGEKLGLYNQESTAVLTRLHASGKHIAFMAFLGFAAVAAAAVLVWLAAKGFFFLTKGKVPIVTKMLAVFLPILVISLLGTNWMVNRIFRKELIDSQYEELYLLTSQQTATLNDQYIMDSDPETAYDSVYFYEIRAALNLLPGQGTLVETTGEKQEVYNSNYFWLYKMVDDQLVSLICEQDYIGVPVEARYSRNVANEFYRAAGNNEIIRTGFRDRLGEWTILLTPVVDRNGDVIAVIETGDTRQSLDYAVAQGSKQLTILLLSVLGVLALLLSAVIIISLYPLRVLKRGVLDISDGRLGVQVPEKGDDEIAEISRSFNTMSKNVAFRDNEIRQTSDGYSRFVPAKVFGLLDKQSVIDVRLADETSVEAAVLNCAVGAFDEISRSLRSQDMFRLINRVLERLVPVVDETGGMIDRFDRAGLLAIYTDQTDRALDAAVSLCQTLRSAELTEAGSADLDFHVTLSAGPAMIGIVGAEKRLEAMTISEHTSFTGFLRPLAAKYGASILITGSAVQNIENFEERYHARNIGFVYMETLERTERLFDVYDGDDELNRMLKEETKEIFEKGVTLFCSKDYYEARLLFIEVLKKNRRDLAARHYLYLCDTYYREDDPQHDVWLETY